MELRFDDEMTFKSYDIAKNYMEEMFALANTDFVRHVDASGFAFFDYGNKDYQLKVIPASVECPDLESQLMYNRAVRKQSKLRLEQIQNCLSFDENEDFSRWHAFCVYAIPLKSDISWENDYAQLLKLVEQFILERKYVLYDKRVYGDNNIIGVLCTSHFSQLDEKGQFKVPHLHILYKEKGKHKQVNELYDLLICYLNDNLNTKTK